MTWARTCESTTPRPTDPVPLLATGSVRQIAREFEINAANSARKNLRNLMDNAAGAPGIPIGDAFYAANLQHQTNPEEIILDETLVETPELVEEDSPSREVLSKIEAVRRHVKEGATPKQPDPKKIKANQKEEN